MPAEAVSESMSQAAKGMEEATRAGLEAAQKEACPAPERSRPRTCRRPRSAMEQLGQDAGEALAVPRANVELFRKYEAEIRKYAMTRARVLGICSHQTTRQDPLSGRDGRAVGPRGGRGKGIARTSSSAAAEPALPDLLVRGEHRRQVPRHLRDHDRVLREVAPVRVDEAGARADAVADDPVARLGHHDVDGPHHVRVVETRRRERGRVQPAQVRRHGAVAGAGQPEGPGTRSARRSRPAAGPAGPARRRRTGRPAGRRDPAAAAPRPSAPWACAPRAARPRRGGTTDRSPAKGSRSSSSARA